jgi:hypothetical protein
VNTFVLSAVLVFGLAQVAAPPGRATLAELRTRLDAYERKTAATKRDDPAELAAIASAVITETRRSTLFAVWVDACASTEVPESDDCSSRLWTVLNNTRETTVRRANAAVALTAKGEAAAADTLAGLLKTTPAPMLVQLLPVIRQLPARHAVPLLVRISQSPSRDDQAKSCEPLSDFDVPESHAALSTIVDGNPPGTGPWLLCMIARARLHDATPPGAIAGYGDTLKGLGQLFAARVMLELGNDAAVQLLEDLTHRGDPNSRLVAADLLIGARPEAAIPVIEAAESNPEPSIRALALLSERRLKRAPSKTVRSMLVDAAGAVRVRAAEIAIDWAKRSQIR